VLCCNAEGCVFFLVVVHGTLLLETGFADVDADVAAAVGL